MRVVLIALLLGCGAKEAPEACRRLEACCKALPPDLAHIRAIDSQCFQPPTSALGCEDGWGVVQRAIGSPEGLAVLHQQAGSLPAACGRN
jgi:hypothetical protein